MKFIRPWILTESQGTVCLDGAAKGALWFKFQKKKLDIDPPIIVPIAAQGAAPTPPRNRPTVPPIMPPTVPPIALGNALAAFFPSFFNVFSLPRNVL